MALAFFRRNKNVLYANNHPKSLTNEDVSLCIDLKATETEKEGKKEKEAKLEETIEVKIKEEKPKEEATPPKTKPQKPQGNYTSW